MRTTLRSPRDEQALADERRLETRGKAGLSLAIRLFDGAQTPNAQHQFACEAGVLVHNVNPFITSDSNTKSTGDERHMKKSCTRRKHTLHQRELAFPRHGGARHGAGRKPKGKVAGPSHAKRPSTPARFPLLVTHRMCADLPSLRQEAVIDIVRTAIAENAERDGFRIVHFSVQTNHVHYVCEARDAERLTSGMRSLAVKLARRLNKLWKRRGQVIADRFHSRALETPTEVHHAIAYVLNNERKHGIISDGVDPFSSGPWFDGWSQGDTELRAHFGHRGTSKSSRAREVERLRASPSPTADARTWLLRVGWRKLGAIHPHETPGGQVAKRARAREEARSSESIRRSFAAAARDGIEHRSRKDRPATR